MSEARDLIQFCHDNPMAAADHIRTLEAVQADLTAHIRDLEAQLARVRELLPTIMSRAAAVGQYCDELEAALDNPKSAG